MNMNFESTTDLTDRIVKCINAQHDADKNISDVYGDLAEMFRGKNFYQVVSTRMVGRGRWYIVKEDILSVALNDETEDVQYIKVVYNVGATESQSECPASVVAHKVVPQTAIVTEYVAA